MSIAKKLIVPGMVAVAGFAGVSSASLVSSLSASAATASSATGSSTSATNTDTSSMPTHGSASHEDTETPVTGDNATKAQAAAVKSVGSGVAGAITTDYTKTGYETTVTKSDGSAVEVHLDSSFNVMTGHGSDSNSNN